MTDRRTFLITGALGAVGVWTARSLIDRGHQVIAFDIGGDGHRLPLALTQEQLGSLTRVDGDITDISQVEAALARHDVSGVVHLAALQVPFVRADPVRGAQVNLVGTVNVLEAVRRHGGIGPVVYASSIAAYGPRLTLDGDDVAQTLYGVFKRTNEETAVRYFEDFGVSSIGLRPHTVYGPARDQGVTSAVTTAIVAAAAGTSYEVPFGGAVQMQYAPDVGEAFASAALLEYEGAAVHNLDGDVMGVHELVALLASLVPGSAGQISCSDVPLPLVSSVDGSSFVELLGGSLMRPATEGVADALEQFRRLLNDGLVASPGSPLTPA